jgi:hypothetical protein
MVLAAPLFLVSQTRAMRAFVQANSQAFINIGLGMSLSYLTLRSLSKSYELDDLRKDYTELKQEYQYVCEKIQDLKFLEDSRAVFEQSKKAKNSSSTAQYQMLQEHVKEKLENWKKEVKLQKDIGSIPESKKPAPVIFASPEKKEVEKKVEPIPAIPRRLL